MQGGRGSDTSLCVIRYDSIWQWDWLTEIRYRERSRRAPPRRRESIVNLRHVAWVGATSRALLIGGLRLRRWLIPLLILLAAPLALVDTTAQAPPGYDKVVPQFDRTPPLRSCAITLGLGESMQIGLALRDPHAKVAHAAVSVNATPAMYHLPLVVALSGGDSSDRLGILFNVTPADDPKYYTIRGNARGSDTLLRLSKYFWNNGGAEPRTTNWISAKTFRVNVTESFDYDNRPPTVVRFRRAAESVTEGHTLSFRVDLHPPPEQDITVKYSVDSTGDEYLHIPARCARGYITVPTAPNDKPEMSRTRTVRLLNGSGYSVDSTAHTATGEIMDDDELAAVFSDQHLKIAGTATASYQVTLNKPPEHPVTVKITAAESATDDTYFDFIVNGIAGTQTAPKSQSLTFTPGTHGNWNTPQTVSIRSKGKVPPLVMRGHLGLTPSSYDLSLEHAISGTAAIVETRTLPVALYHGGTPRVTFTVGGTARSHTIYTPDRSAGSTEPTSVTLRMCVDRKGFDHGFTVQPAAYYAYTPSGSGLMFDVNEALTGDKPAVTFMPTSFTAQTSGDQCTNITVTAVNRMKTEIREIHCYSPSEKDAYAGFGKYNISVLYVTKNFLLTVMYPMGHYVNNETPKWACPTPFTGYP